MSLHVVFQLGGTDYALPADDVLHLDAWTGATPVPGAAQGVVGLVTTRQRVVPVLDARVRLGLPPAAPTDQSRVIVVSQGGRAMGLLVDRAREVLRLAADAAQPPPGVVAQDTAGVVRAIAHVGQRMILILDLRQLVGPEKLHA